MFSANEKMTVQTPSVGADGEKSPSKCNNSIAPEETEIRNQAQKERLRLLGSQLTKQSSKNFLPTVNLDAYKNIALYF